MTETAHTMCRGQPQPVFLFKIEFSFINECTFVLTKSLCTFFLYYQHRNFRLAPNKIVCEAVNEKVKLIHFDDGTWRRRKSNLHAEKRRPRHMPRF